MSGSFTITNPLTAVISRPQDGRSNKLTVELGQIITATITKKTEAVTALATADGFRFEADSDKISGDVGDELQFEVVKAGKGGLELKQIQRASQEMVENTEARRSSSGLISMLRQSGIEVTDANDTEDRDRDLRLKAMEAASKIKRKLRYVTNNAGRSAMKELLATGVSLEKISIDILNSVMREVEAKPESQTTPDELDAMIDKYMAENNIPVGEADNRKQLITALAEQGLPATAKNVRSLDTVLIKIREIESIDDDSIAKLLKDEKNLTVENIYLAKHTSAKLPAEDKLTPEKWQLLEPEVTRAFEREGIEPTPKALDAAKLLVEREIPVTAENVDKVSFLRELGGLDVHKLLYQAAGRIKQDRVLADVSVYADSLPDTYEDVMADIPFITAAHMEFLLKREPEPTVADCCRVLKERIPAAEVSEQAEAVHDRLLEVRRKLTYEAAGRLISKNIDITEMKLDEAIAQLDSLAEAADYSRNLRAMGAEPTTENVAQMNELYTCIEEITPTPNRVFAALLGRSIPFTIRAMHSVAESRRAAEGYERFATTVTPKYGDKLRERIAPFLENNDIPVTSDNIKAAEILTKNQLAVTPENITEIKLIDLKIAGIQDRLHPNIAATMIKEKRNPLNMHVDEILSYIDGFNDEYGEGVGDKLTEHIRALDDTKALSKDERDAMIAVYRTLNLLRRDQSVGLGLSLKHGAELTLGRLLSDAQNYQRLKNTGDMDIAVDDGFGETERVTPDDNNIRRLLDNVSAKALTECELNSMMIDKFTEQATPAALKRVFDTGADGLLLEEALELMEPSGYDTEARLDRMQASLTAAAELSTSALGRLQYGEVPPTVANMQAMHLLENTGLGKILRKLEERLEDDTFDIPESDLTALGDDSDVLETVSAQLEDVRERIMSHDLLDELILVQNAIKVQQYVGRRERGITLPVRLREGIGDLNVYIDRNAEQQDTVLLALDTPNLGKVRLYISRSDADARVEVAADDVHALAALKRNADALREYLTESGFNAEIEFPEEAEPAAEPVTLAEFEFRV